MTGVTANTVLIVAHSGRPEAIAALRTAVAALHARGISIIVEGEDLVASLPVAERAHVTVHRGPADIDRAQAIIVLGGDGTILRAAELARGTGVPLLGVNLGHVGFLAESKPKDLTESINRLADGDYLVEARGTLDVDIEIPGSDEPMRDWALNEATLEKAEQGKVIDVTVAVDGRPISSFSCDGVVTATATGSTAHAFSGGGPIVWPDVAGTLVVPLAAHALFARPIVLGPHSVVTLHVGHGSGVSGALTTDGRRSTDVPIGSRIEIRYGTEPVLLARMSTAPFADRLVEKFALPVIGWREQAAERAAEGR